MSTNATWIIREITTVKHLRGLLEGLESHGVRLDYESVRIMSLRPDSDSGIELPGEMFPDGQSVVLTYDTLPPEGILLVTEDAG
ncbi:hypothetical protein [Nocardia carnea]|uniref:hypothetical protein n=1 Tax=Nocardia carnea TaxID=37328 RepID=UPI0024557BFD|nr:hypothetical protein [Nocardia carnea]